MRVIDVFLTIVWMSVFVMYVSGYEVGAYLIGASFILNALNSAIDALD